MPQSLFSIRYKDILDPKTTVPAVSLQFSETTKIVILSDTHLGTKFDPELYDALQGIITQAAVIILNGDFWDDAKVRFEEFINSPWNQLFPLLKTKHSVYLFGNHDMPMHADERVFQFCDQAAFRIDLQAGNIHACIEHGHLLSGGMVQTVLRLFETRPRLLGWLTDPFGITSKILSSMNRQQSSLIRLNNPFKSRRLRSSDASDYFLMGHTHQREVDEVARYINSGTARRGVFSYVTIHHNAIALIEDVV